MVQWNLIMQPLTVSPSMPSIPDVVNNLQLYLDATSCLLAAIQPANQQTIHQVLMFDETAIKKRLQ
jgi:hypothetical protein